MTGFEVSVSMFFDAESPEDAVRRMVEWLQENASVAGYRWQTEDTNETGLIDAEHMRPVLWQGPAVRGACIIVGADGENPDDCTTHDHEG